MRAYRLHKDDTAVHLDTVPVPTLGPQDVLIRVKAVGLAPGPFTLLRSGRLSHDPPFTLGHEVAGVVEKVGSDVDGVEVGARVRVHPNLCCRRCKYCLSGRDQMCAEAGIMGFQYFGRAAGPVGPGPGEDRYQRFKDGGLAEYMRVPAWTVDRLPENVGFAVGARVHELATAYCTLKAAGVGPGATVIVLAPTGAVGTAMVRLAHFFGIGRLILVGRSVERLQAVQKLSDSVPCEVVAFDQLPEGWAEKGGLARRLKEVVPEGADALIDLIGSGTNAWQAFAGLAVGGTYVHLGANSTPFPIPPVGLMVNCWKVVGTRNHSRGDAAFVLARLTDGALKVDELVTHRWKFEELNEAIARIQDRSQSIWFGVVEM